MTDEQTTENSGQNNKNESSSGDELYVIGVGASAGGLEAIQSFLAGIPQELTSVAIVIAQHLSPSHKSLLASLLSKATSRPVREIVSGEKLTAGVVYIAPPDSEVTLKKGRLQLRQPVDAPGPKPSINLFFQTLAEEYREKAVGVILSGTGSDGAKGIRAVRANNGLTLAQEPSNARYDGMPLSAIETDQVDIVMPPEDMGVEIRQYLEQGIRETIPLRVIEEEESAFDKIRSILSQHTGTDFKNYKKPTMLRRINKRMSQIGIQSLDDYLQILEKDEREIDLLFSTILIGVTSFFRDPESFHELETYITKIVERKEPGDSIRFWIAASATGEEAYTIAIILLKVLGSKIGKFNIQIFATDISEAVIQKARRGIYSESSVEDVPEDIREQYFTKVDGQYEVVKPVRQMILFSRHDITSNPPFLKLDLISCRNLLIYFDSTLQKHTIPLLHYALNLNGYLFLGKSETVGQFSDLFEAVDSRHKIYQRKMGSKATRFNFDVRSIRRQRPVLAPDVRRIRHQEQIKAAVIKSLNIAYAIVNENMDVIELHGDLSDFLTLPKGEMNLGLVRMVREEYQIDVRAVLNEIIKDESARPMRTRRLSEENFSYYVRMRASTVPDKDDDEKFFIIAFERVPVEEKFSSVDGGEAGDIERIHELESELNETKTQMQVFIEELETSNEELQSLNEELQSTNEELQSTNEELETSNEELQSTNEEIQIAYGELRSLHDLLAQKEKSLEISSTNLEAMVNHTLQWFILLDSRFNIITLNLVARNRIRETFNLEISEGDSIYELLTVLSAGTFFQEHKTEMFEEILSLEVEIPQGEELLFFRIIFHPVMMKNEEETTHIAVNIVDITQERVNQNDLIESDNLLKAVFQQTEFGIAVIDKDLRFTKINSGFAGMLGFTVTELIGQSFFIILPAEDRKEKTTKMTQWLSGVTENGEWKMQRKDGSIFDVFFSSQVVHNTKGSPSIVSAVHDISESMNYRTLLEQTQESAKVGGWEYDVITGVNTWTEEVYNIYEVPHDFEVNVANGMAQYLPEDREKLEKAFNDAIERGIPFDLELRFESSMGNHKWVRSTCKPVRIHNKTVKLFGTFQDITLRKQNEWDIERLSLVASRATNGVIITDAKGYTEWVNDGFTRLTGYTQEEARGKKPGDLLQGEGTSEDVRERLRKCLAAREPCSTSILNYKKDGSSFWINVDITPLKDRNGEVYGYVGMQTDITALMRNEEKLKKSLDEKEILIKEIHHRVKNNLAVISGLFSMQSEYVGDEALKLILKEGQSRIQTMALIHEKLYRSGNLAEIEILPYVEDLLKSVKEMYGENKDISFYTHIEKISLSISQAVPLSLILHELLTNAYKHAFVQGEKGTVNVSLIKGETNAIELVVSDNGRGLPEKLDIERPGTLGMTLIQGLISQLGGTFHYEEEKGSRFILEFPHEL